MHSCSSRLGRTVSASTIALLALVLVGCAASAPRVSPQTGFEVPRGWTSLGEVARRAGAGTALPARWWREFDDAALDVVIEEALLNNHDILAAAARVDSAAATARIAGADALPSVDVSLDGARSQRAFIGFPIEGQADSGRQVLSTKSDQFGVSVGVSWELDLWGRVRAAKKAARAEYQAAQADLDAAELSIAAQTAKAWFAAVEAARQLGLAQRTVANYQSSLDRVDQRYKRGLRSSLDVHLARSELERARAQTFARRSAADRAHRQLEILLGRYPAREIETAQSLAEPVGAVPAGLPADLVARRPDVVAAERRLAAAGASVDEARAALLPRLSLTGSYGTATEAFSDVLDTGFEVWDIAGRLLQPVFQGGRLRAGLRRAGAREKELLAAYASALLRAFAEVESLLADEGYFAAQTGALAASAKHAEASRRLSESRYLEGLEDYITVLSSQRAAFDAQSALLDARRRRLDTRLDLYLALGGGFSDQGRVISGGVGPRSTQGGAS